MKNKILLIALTFSLAFNISACTEILSSGRSYDERMHEPMDDGWYVRACEGYMVIDEQTQVEYWYIPPSINTNGGTGGCLTLLVDQDGKPLVYKGE